MEILYLERSLAPTLILRLMKVRRLDRDDGRACEVAEPDLGDAESDIEEEEENKTSDSFLLENPERVRV